MSADEEVSPSLIHLQEEINIIKEKINQILINNRNLKDRIYELTSDNNILFNTIYDIEVNLSHVDQYSRRSNVEICNIPEKINQRNIEIYVLKVMESIGVRLQSFDLVAVHRVGKFRRGKNRNVIVRFINRKNAYQCLRNNNKLKNSVHPEYKKLFFIENLCPTNKNIFNFLYKMKKLAKIKNVWSYNGSVFYTMIGDEEEFAVRADHMDDLENIEYINDLSVSESSGNE